MLDRSTPDARTGPEPMLAGEKTPAQMVLVKVFAVAPLLALVAAVPVAWGWGLGWVDIGLAVFFYTVTCLGVTIGFHRYFTHGAFKARRSLRIALAVVGSMAMQGPVVGWLADHRRHHAYADKEGDPHSPWLFGTLAAALATGFWHAHIGWMFQRERTNAHRFAPDLVADNDIQRVDRLFPVLTVVTLLAPAVLGGVITSSWWGAVTAFFWASLVRGAVLHHPTCARHGVQKGQIDISARIIWAFEKLGWATQVRWPRPERLARKLKSTPTPRSGPTAGPAPSNRK